MVQKYNLTSEELASVQKQHETEAFTEDSLAKFISEMRETNAIATSQKDAREIPFDELQVAWETVKDAKEGDALKTKQALQAKSEEMMQQADPNMVDMATAPELSEWLNINNSLENPDNTARNQALGKRLEEYNQQFDQANGLAGISPQQAEQISAASELLSQQYEGFNPFAANDKGELIYPEFENAKSFYEKLNIQNTDKNSENVDREQFIRDMAELAKRETIARLSTEPGFLDLPAEQQKKIFASVYAGYLQEGAVSLVVAQAVQNLDEQQKKDPQTREILEKAANEEFLRASEKSTINISNSAALGAYAGRLQAQTNIEKRISQKTETRGFWGKIKDKKKAFEQKHPKMAGALKFIGNIGLTMGVNMALGGAGLAALGAYKTYQAVKKANEERKAANEKSGQQQSLLKFLVKNPRHLISITSNVASVALAGWSAGMGLDANGLVGQSINHGAGQAWDNMGNAMSNFAGHFSVDNLKNSLGDGNIGHGWGDRFSNMFSTDNSLRFARTIRTLGVATANLGVDIAEIAKPENKGKRMKMFFKALGKAGLSSAAVFATTPVENADAAPIENSNIGANNHGDITPPWQQDQQQDPTAAPWQQPQETAQTPSTPDNYVEDPERMANVTDNENTVESTASQKDLEFWENRTDKFLGEENKQYIYDLVEKGEIKLPEGIETKEEYAYKLAMDIQQTPAEINAVMGGEWKSSAALTDSIKSWTAEDFNKLNDSIDDFSDRGYHNGEIPGGRTHAGSDHTGDGHKETEPVTDTPGHDIDIRAITKETLIDTFEDFRGVVGDAADGSSIEAQLAKYDALMMAGKYDEATAYMKKLYEESGISKPFEESNLAKADFDYRNALSGPTNDPDLSDYASSLKEEAAPVQETHDETYYQEQKEAIQEEHGQNSLKQEINLARQSDLHTVEETVDQYMEGQVADGHLTEQQGEEVGNLVKHEMDGRDGNQDGQIDDKKLSRGDVRRGMREVNRTLDAMSNNAEEIAAATQLQGDLGVKTEGQLPDTNSSDVKDPQFYQGMSKVIHDMQTGDRPVSAVMQDAIRSGELSKEQIAAMNLRDKELQQQGLTQSERLEQMSKDYARMGKYHEAQEAGQSKTQQLINESKERINSHRAAAAPDQQPAQTVQKTQAQSYTPTVTKQNTGMNY